jgi:predicted DsbA family dithiol-disulfide isomerase
MAEEKLVIDYYTDVLCVWAWIAQRRVDELNATSGSKIQFRHRYVDLFGDTATRINEQWSERGLYEGFCEHVCEVAAPYSTAPVNPLVWRKARPATSSNAHLVIKAVELAHGADAGICFALAVRKAFFIDALDIGNLELLLALANQQDFANEPVKEAINNGAAIASLMSDFHAAKSQGIKGSPSYVIDGGRQTLYGNIGFRVLHANISELLNHPSGEASWC